MQKDMSGPAAEKSERFKEGQKEFFDILTEKRKETDIYEFDEIERIGMGFFQTSIRNFSRKAKSGSIIFDLGGGEGRSAFESLHSRNDVKVTIVDISKNSLRRAMIEDSEGRILFCLADCENLPFRPNSCEYVMLINLLHHMKDFRILDELKSCMKRDGEVLIIDIVTNNPLREFAKSVWKYLPKEIKNKVAERDLVIDGKIPDTHDFKLWGLRKQISRRFEIKSEHTHGTFAFVFSYVIRMFPFLHTKFSFNVLKYLNKLDNILSEKTPMRIFSTIVVYELIRK